MPPRKPPVAKMVAGPENGTPDPAGNTAEPIVKPDPDSVPATDTAQASAGADDSSTAQQPISLSSTPAAASPAPSSTPGPATERPASNSRPGTARAGSARGKPIVKPKNTIRRSQAQRAEAEKAESERQRLVAEQKAKQDAAKARRDANQRIRGRGDGRVHRGRGRGGYMGERDREKVSMATGAFGSGQVSSDFSARRGFAGAGRGGGGGGGGGFSGGGGGSGGGGVKREPGAGGDGTFTMMSQPIKTEDGGYISSDDEGVEDGARRVNVDHLIDLTGDDEELPQQQGAFQPVRIKREAHKERTVGVNADGATTKEDASDGEGDKQAGTATSEKKKGKQRTKDVEVTGQSESFQAAYSSSEEQEAPIKAEPADDDEAGVDPMVPQEPPSSPESRRKNKPKVKTRTLSGSAPERPVYQTQEEVDEWDRHQRDLGLLYSELGSLVLPTSTDQDGDATMAESGQQSQDKKADKVYLFQFPPVLPDLVPINVKPDPEASTAENGDVMEVDKQPINATNPVAVVDEAGQAAKLKLPSGAVGKLRIHKSGKATLDWGGTSLLVGMGTEATFLQDVMVATLPDRKEDAEGEAEEGPTGVAMSMGQVKGKFVVTPDWDKLLA